MDFIPHDSNIIQKMLKSMGIGSLKELFNDIPNDIMINKLDIPKGLAEPELLKKVETFSFKNKIYSSSFLGAGCYYHYIPSLVDFVISRSEFYTSYTPYQAEASQGYLQAIFEYQSIISRLTKMEVSNASMYDGSTALAEAAIMASYITGKNKIIISDNIHPEYIEVVRTYCWGYGLDYIVTSEESLLSSLNNETAAFLFQNPNFFGEIEDVEQIVKIVRERSPKCLVIQVMTEPISLGIIKPPGDLDIDIFVAEGQSFGISPSFGGPGLGIFTAKEKYLRKIPGRLVGKTREIHGEKEGYILTLQAREQHIRREKAISNICTNQALCALAALIYLISLGGQGLREIAIQNIQKADYVKRILNSIEGYRVLNKKPTFNEFLVECPNINELRNRCQENDLLSPLDFSRYFPEKKNVALVCVTEMNSKESIDTFLNIAQSLSDNRGGK